MTFKLSILGAAVLAAASLTAAQAQTGTTSTSTSASTGTGTSITPSAGVPKGQLSTPNQDKGYTPRPSLETRADVKADTAAAKGTGSLPQGVQSTPEQGKKPKSAKTGQNSRAEVKAEAAAANRAGTSPKGEESVRDQNKGGVKR